MANNVGIILPNLGMSQLSYLAINQANILADRNDLSLCLFYYSNVLPCMKVNVASMNIGECVGFNGLLIATNIDSAVLISNIISPAKKLFYVWDLEWLRNRKDFQYNMKAFRNLDMVCRSNSHAKVIENYCNMKPKLIVPNFNLNIIMDSIK